jgi:hypothetical protein
MILEPLHFDWLRLQHVLVMLSCPCAEKDLIKNKVIKEKVVFTSVAFFFFVEKSDFCATLQAYF